jgi:hypothetical protein
MRNLVGLLMAGALAISSSASIAATAHLASHDGKVLVNSGEGFKSASGFSQLNAGDRVFVGPESSALIAYENGCSVEVPAGSVVSIAKNSPCAAGGVVKAGSVITPVADMDPSAAAVGSGLFGSGAAGLLPFVFLGTAVVITGGVLILSDNNSGATS